MNSDQQNNNSSEPNNEKKPLNELTVLIYSVIESAVNQFMALDEETVQKLDLLDQKVIGLQLTDMNLSFYILINDRRLHLLPEYEGTPNTTIKTKAETLINMGIKRGDTKTAVTGSLEISGELETGTLFKSILDQMHIDWEEHLSRLTGDMVASQIGLLFSSVKKWGQNSYDSLGQSLSDYLTQEKRLVAHEMEVRQFVSQVDELRHAVDRCEARLRRLEARKQHGRQE